MNGTKPIAILAGIGMITALVGTSSAQFLSLDGFTEPIIAHAKTNDKLVSVSFDNATTRDVIQWMTKSNLNFIFKKADKASNQRISMKLTDVPATEAIEAICDALGMGYSKKGSTYVITESGRYGTTFGVAMPARPSAPRSTSGPAVAPTAPDRFRVDTMPAMPAMPTMPAIEIDLAPLEAMKGFAWADADFAKGNQEAQKAADQAMKAALEAEKAAAQNDTKKAVQLAKEAAAAAKRAAELSKARSFEFKMDGEAFKKLHEELGKIKPDTKAWKRFGDEMKAFGEAHAHGAHGGIAHVRDTRELLKSITPAQWELHKKQGYLKLSDLTEAQRKMIGNPSGAIQLKIQKDDKVLEIRSSEGNLARPTRISTTSPAI